MGGLVVLVVTQHHIHTTREDFARYTGMTTVDAHLHAWSRFAARVGDEILPIGIANDGRTLGHAVTYSEWEVDLLEQLLYLAIEPSATNNDLIKPSAKGFHQTIAELGIDSLAHSRYLAHGANLGGIVLGHDTLADNLFDKHGHHNDEVRTNLLEGLQDDGGTECAIDERDMNAHDELIHQFERHAVEMSGRKQREDLHARTQVGKNLFGECHIAP